MKRMRSLFQGQRILQSKAMIELIRRACVYRLSAYGRRFTRALDRQRYSQTTRSVTATSPATDPSPAQTAAHKDPRRFGVLQLIRSRQKICVRVHRRAALRGAVEKIRQKAAGLKGALPAPPGRLRGLLRSQRDRSLKVPQRRAHVLVALPFIFHVIAQPPNPLHQVASHRVHSGIYSASCQPDIAWPRRC